MGGRRGGFRGVIQTQLFLPSISMYEFLHIYICCMNWNGLYSTKCVCVCVCMCVCVCVCAILSGVVAGVCMVCNGTSDGMTGVCVMSDGVLCVMCRGAHQECVCVPSAAVTGVFSGGVAWNIGGDSRNSRTTSTASYLLLKLP